MKKKFFIKTFGCQMNFYDSRKISNILNNNNFSEINYFEFSDIIIINTCCIREKSQKKIFKFLDNIYIKYKNKFLIIIGGCTSVLFARYLIKKKNYINIIFSPQSIYCLPYLINLYYFYKCKQININYFSEKNFNKNLLNNYSYLTIMEGCNKYCTYCIIPYTRGIEVSKNLNYILLDLFNLKKLYIKQIYLLGQNVNSYNGKINKKINKIINFNILINFISQIFKIKYINFITSHPKEFNFNIIKLYNNKYNKLLNFLHLPIQSCSNKILFSMRREYKVLDYKNILYRLKLIRYNLFISTDIIIGFPGENYVDFNKTLIFFEKFLFDKSYIFIYNFRPYTNNNFYNNIPDFINQKRFIKIHKKLKNNIFYINKSMIGKIENIFIKSICLNYNNIFFGFTNNNRLIKFFLPKNFHLNLTGSFLKIKILIKSFNFFLGKLIF